MAADGFIFKEFKKDGTPYTCKFCHSPVWHHFMGRVYDVGGEALHVDRCELRKEYYRNEAIGRSQSRRDNRR